MALFQLITHSMASFIPSFFIVFLRPRTIRFRQLRLQLTLIIFTLQWGFNIKVLNESQPLNRTQPSEVAKYQQFCKLVFRACNFSLFGCCKNAKTCFISIEKERDDGDVDFYSLRLNSPLILIQSNKPNTSSGSFIHFTFGNFDEWFQKKEQREEASLSGEEHKQTGREV